LFSSDPDQIALSVDGEAGHRIERRRRYRFTRAKVKPGMMPRAPDCLAHH
jgi:hypothetical protein